MDGPQCDGYETITIQIYVKLHLAEPWIYCCLAINMDQSVAKYHQLESVGNDYIRVLKVSGQQVTVGRAWD